MVAHGGGYPAPHPFTHTRRTALAMQEGVTMGPTDLKNRTAPLEMTPEAFPEAGHRLVDEITELLAGLPAGPVTRVETPRSVRKLLPSAVPEEGAEAASLVAETAPLLFDHSLPHTDTERTSPTSLPRVR
jgi:hypothetical protein